MVTIMEPDIRASEGNVLRALRLPRTAITKLRWVGGQYRAALIGKRKSNHAGHWEPDKPRPTSAEAHYYYYGYGRGYEEATKHLLDLLYGEEAAGMYTAWAEPVDGDKA